MTELIDILRSELDRLEKKQEDEVAEGVEKIVNTQVIISITAMFKVIKMTYEQALESGLSHKTAESMAYGVFKQHMNVGVR